MERKGGSSNITFTDYNGNDLGRAYVPEHFDYVVVPLLFRAAFGQKIKYFANAGAFFGYLTKQTTMGSRTGPAGLKNVDNTYHYERTDAGISAGLGISIPVKSKFSISMEVRENYGLTDVSKAKPDLYGSIKTSSTNFLLGLAYEI